MKETTKAMARRAKETSFPWADILLSGRVLDVGSGDDPLPEAVAFNLADGAGDDLTKFFPACSFDTIHASQVLEHMLDPVVALRSWLEVLRPGGYIVATVPDFKTYEKLMWPSRWNQGHRSTWSMDLDASPAPIHCKMPEWLAQFPVEVLLCRLITSNYDFALSADVDQTFNKEKNCECFIEFVLKK